MPTWAVCHGRLLAIYFVQNVSPLQPSDTRGFIYIGRYLSRDLHVYRCHPWRGIADSSHPSLGIHLAAKEGKRYLICFLL